LPEDTVSNFENRLIVTNHASPSLLVVHFRSIRRIDW